MRKFKLPRAFRKDWLEKLESGKYVQGTGQLYHEGAYCCLGVAGLSLGLKNNQLSSSMPVNLLSTYRDKYPACLLGSIDQKRSFASILATMNDNGKSFKEIAKYIRKHTIGV